MSTFTAVFDACVLYPAPVRDFLLWLAQSDLFRARWTDRIHDEWTSAVLAKRPELAEQLTRTRGLMNEAVPDCLVMGYEGLIDSLELPDPADRHVLAAAIRCQAGVIVTYNIKDFPAEVLDMHGLEAQHPDDFVEHLLGLSPAAVCNAARKQRANLTRPPKSPEEFLVTLAAHGFTKTVAQLEEMAELI